VLDVEAAVHDSSSVVLECSIAALETEGTTLALASTAGSSVVT
jgi:hypothetical protein